MSRVPTSGHGPARAWPRARRSIFAVLYLFAAGVFFVIAMEEISWGQRFLDLESPEFFVEHNSQGEITLHNLYDAAPFTHKGFILIGFLGAFVSFPVKATVHK